MEFAVDQHSRLQRPARSRRSGVPIGLRYIDIAAGWQHWIGPQVEVRPEIGYYRAPDVAAFDNGTARRLWFFGGDIIWHF
jgi:hypothetical protein